MIEGIEKMIEGVELIVYDTNGNNFSMDLSPTQLLAVCKILGIQTRNGELSYFSDDSLKVIMSKTIDNFVMVKKQPKNGEQNENQV